MFTKFITDIISSYLDFHDQDSFHDLSHEKKHLEIFPQPQITLHRSIFRRTTVGGTHLKVKSFLDSNWTYEIIENNIHLPLFLLIEDSIKIDDLSEFNIEIQLLNYECSYNLDISSNTMSGGIDETSHYFRKLHGYYWIPLLFFINQNKFIFFNDEKLTIKLSSSINVVTKLKYYQSFLGEIELRQQTYTDNWYYTQDIVCSKFNQQKTIVIPDGMIRYISWKTTNNINQITITNTKSNKKYSLYKEDFQVSERIKIHMKPLEDNWGAIYFSLIPFDFSKESGSLICDNDHTITFDTECSGTLWISTLCSMMFDYTNHRVQVQNLAYYLR